MNRIIRKGLSLVLAVLFSLSPAAAAVAGHPTCGKMSAVNAAKNVHHPGVTSIAFSMSCCTGSKVYNLHGTASLSVGSADFCGGSLAGPCNLQKGSNFDVLSHILLRARPCSHCASWTAVPAGSVFSGIPAKQGVNPQLHYATLSRSAPIYLQTLALRC